MRGPVGPGCTEAPLAVHKPKPNSDPEAVCAELAGMGLFWKVTVRYRPRARLRSDPDAVLSDTYPKCGTSDYDFEEMLNVLRIFNQRYTEFDQVAPPELEPEAIGVSKDLSVRVRVVLSDLDAAHRERAKRAASAAPVPEDGADD